MSYTLAQVKQGTGFPPGVLFEVVPTGRAELIGLLRDVQTALQTDDGWLRIEQRIDAVLGTEVAS